MIGGNGAEKMRKLSPFTGLSPFSRRDMLKAGGAGALMAAGATILPAGAIAKSDRTHKQAPGYFRFSHGEFEITVLSDGNLVLPVNFMAGNVPEATLKAFLGSNYLDTQSHLSHVNLSLINTGKEMILVDTGCGPNFQESAGKLVDNLAAAGIKPEQIDKIILTHGHPDHVFGIIDEFEDSPLFPNAEYYMNADEWAFWTADDAASKLADGFASFAAGAKRNLLPISGRTKRIKPGDEIAPGVRAIASYGHTLGHISVMVQSQKEQLLITGDAINHAQISFEHPDWEPKVDMDGAKAVISRKKLLDMAATDRITVVGYHLPFPGVGHVARNGSGYRWVPALWRWEL